MMQHLGTKQFFFVCFFFGGGGGGGGGANPLNSSDFVDGSEYSLD